MTTARRGLGHPIRLRTSSPEETRALAGALARSLVPGDVVTLSGELGAGKTCFVQGVAQALGVQERVVSPTFIIVRSYAGTLPEDGGDVQMVHVDVYRLNRLQEMIELGEDTLMGPDQITLIEWGDTVDPLLPPDRLEVEFLLGDGADDRLVRLLGHGSWSARIIDLLPALVDWLEGGDDGRGIAEDLFGSED